MFWKTYLPIFIVQAILVFVYIIWPMLRAFGAWALDMLDSWSPAEPELQDAGSKRPEFRQRGAVWGDYSERFEQAFTSAQTKTRPPPPPPARPQPDPRRDYLRTLGLSGSPDPKLLRSTYRKLAKKYHPDRYASATYSDAHRRKADEKMRALNEAYDWLSQNG